jgi:hypothetical protein
MILACLVLGLSTRKGRERSVAGARQALSAATVSAVARQPRWPRSTAGRSATYRVLVLDRGA